MKDDKGDLEKDKDIAGCESEAEAEVLESTKQKEEVLVQSEEDADSKLKEAERKAEENRDAWLRAKAESENIRKRAETDVANAHKFGIERFAQKLLPVRDSLEAALGSKNIDLSSLKNGVELTLKQIDEAFKDASIEEVEALGRVLDPNKHQAMGLVDSEDPPNTIKEVLQKGYILHGRLLRPSLVNVSKQLGDSES